MCYCCSYLQPRASYCVVYVCVMPGLEGCNSCSVVWCVGSGLVTPSGVTSVPVGMETPDMIELRKRRIEDAMDQGGDTPAVPYAVLPEKKTGAAGAMMGSTHVYDIAAV